MYIKAGVLAVLMGQSLGVLPCRRESTSTPFAFISSQINVPDVKGKRSLFEEEMYRAKTNLDVLRGIATRGAGLAFIVVDEIFSSTNPVEGIAGACSVAANLGKQERACCIISTHYTYICRLQKTTGRFFNVQMPVHSNESIEANGSNRSNKSNDEKEKKQYYRYPYKVVPGVCRQYIALELLRQNDFDDDVVDEALRVKQALTLTATAAE